MHANFQFADCHGWHLPGSEVLGSMGQDQAQRGEPVSDIALGWPCRATGTGLCKARPRG